MSFNNFLVFSFIFILGISIESFCSLFGSSGSIFSFLVSSILLIISKSFFLLFFLSTLSPFFKIIQILLTILFISLSSLISLTLLFFISRGLKFIKFIIWVLPSSSTISSFLTFSLSDIFLVLIDFLLTLFILSYPFYISFSLLSLNPILFVSSLPSFFSIGFILLCIFSSLS